MEKNTNFFSLTILGLLLASIGIVAPIAWDWWSSSSGLTLTPLQDTVLVEKKANVDELEIIYKGSRVENLSKITFSLKNTGRLPIVEDDLIEPPNLTLSSGSILNAAVESTNPSNLKAAVKTVDNTVQLSFRLLNPNDSITFSVLADSLQADYNATARIKNISSLEIGSLDERVSLSKDIGWTVYVVGILSAFFGLIGFVLLAEIPKKKAQLKLIKKRDTPVHAGEPMSTIKNYIASDLNFLSGSQEKAVNQAVPDNAETLSEEQAEELISVIEHQVNKEQPLAGAILAFLVSALGIWYVFSNLFISAV